ncbi:putative N-acetylmuramoyl-L-alanine amidase [Nostoc sp. NIES-3756]|uniref:peptidoglycan-binding domain-containing protein n=1 Tax=Nostoc sp. NIES-3756 TaxID=1751286 RepID=UPI000721671D|nr:peptidoglycan-binding protein [Nostoc sp. NIES-3756]BAT51755.1 putative N-acetylmuramoyl-L-alanine amidase [Nostoc sp. NIES-3756]BAY40534.1 putative N-acetylmuramoyl-L-alanine amidase [Nostoc sp. NIES-2111]
MDTLSYSHLASVYEASEDIDFIPIKVNLKFWQWQKLSSNAAIKLLSVALTISILGVAGEALALQQVGSKGAEVANTQRCLKRLGFFNGPVNGNFAGITRSAVIGFQRANRLTSDGVVGVGTQRALQRACRTATTPKTNTSGELLLGSRGAAVTQLQKNLRRLGYFNGPITGYFGTETQQAVIRFQRANRIATVGIVGNQTAQAIRNAINGVGGEYQVVSEGSTGQDVIRLQQRLRQLGYFNANPTGNFGGITKDAVIAFQRNAGLPITGVVNIATWNALDGVSTPGRPSLSTQQIRDLQQRLRDLGYFNGNPTGTVGAMTRDAIVRFQRNYGLSADGIVDAQILQAVTQAWEDRYANQPTRDYLTVGDRGNNVRAVQQRLSELGFFNGSPDGYFDDWTRQSVVAFQQYYQINPTGNVDWQTWNALNINNSGSIRQVSNNSSNNRYVVIVPVRNGSTLNQVRRYVPDAYTAKSNLGTFVNAGSFSDRASAERTSRMLRSNGLDARVQYF